MNVIVMSIFAGVLGTGLGGLLTAVFGSRTDKAASLYLSFAGGVMISIVFSELIPEAVKLSNIWLAMTGLAIGVTMVLFLNGLLDLISSAGKKKSRLRERYKKFCGGGEAESKRSLIQSGVLMFFAIALHNIPEGLAIGTAGYHDMKLGATLALMIAIHDIPEGMAISAPLISGNIDRGRAILMAFLAGSTTVLGAVAGVLIGSVSDFAVALSFSIAGGAMLYVVFGEIVPQAMAMRKDRAPALVLLAGAALGLLLTGM